MNYAILKQSVFLELMMFSRDVENDTKQKSNRIGTIIGASEVEFRVKNFRPGNPAHNAQQPLESIQFVFETEEELNNFRDKVREIAPHSIAFIGYANTKSNEKGVAIPIIQLDPASINDVHSALTKTEILSKDQFIETTRSLIAAGIFSGRSSRLEESLQMICDALAIGKKIEGREISAQVSGGWMSAGQQNTPSGIISAEEAWAFLFKEMGNLGNDIYKQELRRRLESHFSQQEYPSEVKRLWSDVFSNQEGYKRNSPYAHLENFLSERLTLQSTTKQPQSEIPKHTKEKSETIVHQASASLGSSSPLSELLKSVEKDVGKFSKYKTTSGHGQNIPFTKKPAQQFLHGLGVKNEIAQLSTKADGQPIPENGNPDVRVSSFDPKLKSDLVISGARIDRLRKSAKTYVNTDIFPNGYFKEILNPETLEAQTQEKSTRTGIHLQNMAVGVCHVQEIDLLAIPATNEQGESILVPKTGRLEAHDPALLLLSSPALNLAYGTGNHLTKEQQKQYIQSMYRTLFHAAASEGRQYIALPAAGLGVFGGDPETYFEALMKVAREFPQLNIIYNPGDPKNAPLFDKVLESQKPKNIVRTDRDVFILAHQLTQQGKPCAFHNPSDADVVFGIYDVGEYWKNGKGSGYVGEEHIGAMSTAPLNSRNLNPRAYDNVAEHSFLPKPLYTNQHHAFIQHFIQHHSSGVERLPLIRKDQGMVQIEFSNTNFRKNFSEDYKKYLVDAKTWENKGKAYLSIPLKQIEAMENELLKTRYEHFATSNQENREVATMATCADLNQSFKERYKQCQGDHLKSTILKDFYEDLENAETEREVDDVVNRYKKDGRYDILAKAQNNTMQVLGMTTTSAKAFESLITERMESINAQKFSKAS